MIHLILLLLPQLFFVCTNTLSQHNVCDFVLINFDFAHGFFDMLTVLNLTKNADLSIFLLLILDFFLNFELLIGQRWTTARVFELLLFQLGFLSLFSSFCHLAAEFFLELGVSKLMLFFFNS